MLSYESLEAWAAKSNRFPIMILWLKSASQAFCKVGLTELHDFFNHGGTDDRSHGGCFGLRRGAL